jgi:hypothetical protein
MQTQAQTAAAAKKAQAAVKKAHATVKKAQVALQKAQQNATLIVLQNESFEGHLGATLNALFALQDVARVQCPQHCAAITKATLLIGKIADLY